MNKSNAGRALIVAGSQGMMGAGLLCARAAARSGAGYVFLMSLGKSLSRRDPDFLTLKADTRSLLESGFSAVAFGPGLGTGAKAQRLFDALLKKGEAPTLIDADGLNLLAKKKKSSLAAHWILTPHEGELSRLLGVSTSKIRKSRERYVRMAQKMFGCVVLLKGHRTLVADSKRVFVVKSGNPSLAKAGTGDVLSGIICAFLCQGLQASDAATLGAFVHGYLADLWISEGKDVLSLMASDLVEALPRGLRKIRGPSRNAILR